MTLVLLPGMDGTGQLFAPFVVALGHEFNVKVVRYPTAEPMGYAELEALARAALPEEGPFVILGESFSGPVAVSLAASASCRLKGLVLCCTFVRNPRPLFAWVRSLVGFLPVGSAPIGVLSHLLLGRFATAELRSALVSVMSQVSPSALRARVAAVLAVDVSSKLAAANVPTLYLRASRDRVVPLAASKLVSELNPQVHVAQFEAPHFLLQTAPVEAAHVVGCFMRGLHKANPRSAPIRSGSA